ncbi:MAG: protein-export chaperone SecB [Gammaproteobacteria bacterium RBG_16_57_12]|nr:MAG: protein-export chaperone SecB [Gammaproteobacteria bacterium RBG_16_57_12]
MSANSQGNGQDQATQQIAIQKIYVKDSSLEVPGSPQIFTEKWEPTLNLDINSQARILNDGGAYEVVLALTVTVKLADKIAYLVEVQQAGIFVLKGFEGPLLQGVLGSYCPNILFPYAREVVSDLVTKAGFPQLVLAPVNFDALYTQHVERVQQGQSAGQPQSPVH